MNDRTKKLIEMKARHRERISQIRAFEDHTREARDRIVREETVKHNDAIRAEEDSISHALDAEIERAYRAAHGPGRAIDATAELRLARIREEVRDSFEAGRLDPIREHEKATRAGDTERAATIAKIGGRFLDGFRRQRLAELAEANLPEKEKAARARLATLEREKEDLALGLSMQRMARGA